MEAKVLFLLNIVVVLCYSLDPLLPGKDGNPTTTPMNQPTTQPVNGPTTNAPVNVETKKPTTQSGNGEMNTQTNEVNVQTNPLPVITQTILPSNESVNGQLNTQATQVVTVPENGQVNLTANDTNNLSTVQPNAQQITYPGQQQQQNQQLKNQDGQLNTPAVPENGQVNVTANGTNNLPTVQPNRQQINNPGQQQQQQQQNQQMNQQMGGQPQIPGQNPGQYHEQKHAPGDKDTVKYETNLLSDILGNYSTGMRPVKSSHVPAVINFDLKLNKLVKLDTKEQVLIVDAFVLMHWIDPQLRWENSSYNGTDIVNIPHSKIWTPDIVLYNTADNIGKAHTDIYTAPVVTRSNGTALWTNAVTLKASCDVNIKWFPVDSQECPLTFGSWSYSADRLKIAFNNKPVSKEDIQEAGVFFSNGVWDFISFSSKASSRRFSCCREPFSQIEYKFKLQRRPTFFLLYLIFPCIAIVILALLSYVIPPEAGERIGFGVTVILSFSVYLIVISDKLPEKSDSSPLLGILYVVIFYLLVFSFVISTINARLYFNKHRPPKWLLDWTLGTGPNWSWSLSKKFRFRKGENKIMVKPFQDQEMKSYQEEMRETGKKENLTSWDMDCGDNNEETYKTQWHAISAYLDKLFFKIIVVLVVGTPLIVIRTL